MSLFGLLLVYVGCRDLYVVIKISILEEVSSVGACYLLYCVDVDIAVSVR